MRPMGLRTIVFPAAATVVFLILGAIYAVAVPLFEAPDERNHIGLIAYLAETGSWPRQQPGIVTAWHQEGSQPPLYYGVLAGLTGLFGWPDGGPAASAPFCRRTPLPGPAT